MENKYFTPDIEDIYIGYECEILYPHNMIEYNEKLNENLWEKHKFELRESLSEGDSMSFDYIYRTLYLTKKQIEGELINDWKFNELTSTFQKKIIRENFILNVDIYYNNFFKKLQIKVIEEHEEFNKLSKTEYNLYNGQCKDINTFRKIIKLLGI